MAVNTGDKLITVDNLKAFYEATSSAAPNWIKSLDTFMIPATTWNDGLYRKCAEVSSYFYHEQIDEDNEIISEAGSKFLQELAPIKVLWFIEEQDLCFDFTIPNPLWYQTTIITESFYSRPIYSVKDSDGIHTVNGFDDFVGVLGYVNEGDGYFTLTVYNKDNKTKMYDMQTSRCYILYTTVTELNKDLYDTE